MSHIYLCNRKGSTPTERTSASSIAWVPRCPVCVTSPGGWRGRLLGVWPLATAAAAVRHSSDGSGPAAAPLVAEDKNTVRYNPYTRIHIVQNSCIILPTSVQTGSMSSGSILRGDKASQIPKMTTGLHVVSSIRMRADTHPLPYVQSWRAHGERNSVSVLMSLLRPWRNY